MDSPKPISQGVTPYLDALQGYRRASAAAFHTPGHNRGQGIPDTMATLIGTLPYEADFPDLPGLNLFEQNGAVSSAQELAAELFGVEHTWFLVNGSTVGMMASILATCGLGDKIILPRNVHQSVISGLVLSGAVPIFVSPDYDPAWDLAFCITPSSIASALAQHPDARAVLVVSPTYHGVCGDLRAIVTLAHQHGIPLIVDEAHGAHFAFHRALPASALSLGADLVVQSTHKTLAALTQSAMVHLQGNRISPVRMAQMLQMLQSSSPSSLLLASLDAARAQMATQGQPLMHQVLQLAHQARSQIQQAGLSVLTLASVSEGFVDLDLTRIVVDLSTAGMSGFMADEILTRSGVTAELPTLRQLTFIVNLGTTPQDIERLFTALSDLVQNHKPFQPATVPLSTAVQPSAPLALTPRDAFFAPRVSIPVQHAVGRISTETLCPYPPGIPLVLPGEEITEVIVTQLQEIKAQGGLIVGGSDPDLNEIRVVQTA